MERETHTDSPVNRNFRAEWSVKNAMLTVFWDLNGSIPIDCVEKCTTVNSASCCQLFRQNSFTVVFFISRLPFS